MEFKQLESFRAVVKYQSFTRAAKALYISQPTISSHIRELEEELESRLIVRTTKSLEMTPRGWELYECASNILRLRDDLKKKWTTETKKMIHICASTIPSSYILPEVLPEFGKIFPDIYFIVNQSDSQGVIERMEKEEYDVGLIGMPCQDEAFSCNPFYKDRMVLITPVREKFLSLSEKEHTVLEILVKNPIIMRENGSGSLKSADFFLESMGISEDELSVVARMNDQESIKNMVAGGLGVSIISEKAAKNFVEEKRILSFELPGQVATRSLYYIYHKNYILKPYVKEFMQYLEKYYKNQ